MRLSPGAARSRRSAHFALLILRRGRAQDHDLLGAKGFDVVGELVQFRLVEEKRAKEIEEPPKDPLERAHWVHSVLCEELFDVLNDYGLQEDDRRDFVLKFSAKIIAATPHNDLHAARKQLRDKEKDKTQAGVGGTIKRGQASQSGSLRSGAPKRSNKPKR